MSSLIHPGRGDRRLRRRLAAERRFQAYGIAAIAVSVAALLWLFVAIAGDGVSALRATAIKLDVHFDGAVIDPGGTGDPAVIAGASFETIVRAALRAQFPEVTSRRERRALKRLVSAGTPFILRDLVLADPSLVGTTRSVWVPAGDDADLFVKGKISRATPSASRRISDRQIAWLDALAAAGRLKVRFNSRFFASGDSREPELAGILAALVGTALSLLVCLAVSFPIGAASAIYLEEFARRGHLTGWIEVNINNLAAVPSIVFGLLGLVFFLNVLGLPRSAPLVGGLVLALMTLPTIIIASRASLQAVPDGIRAAALAMGASRVQMVFHHVAPLAMPGMMTGSILGMARALGETAPLLMIGMVAFVVDVPQSILDPATTLPVQIFLWADSPERAFVEKTSAAILVLLAFLIVMNAGAIVLRNRFEKRL